MFQFKKYYNGFWWALNTGGSVNAGGKSCECESKSLRDFVKSYGCMPFLCVSFESHRGSFVSGAIW